jgi:hypothetical protein
MINPNDEILPDDSDSSEADDQQSQKDIHSIGLNETPVDENTTDTDILKQSYDASESAYTLNLGDDKPKKKE